MFVDNDDQAEGDMAPPSSDSVSGPHNEWLSEGDNGLVARSDQDMDEDDVEGEPDRHAPQRAQKKKVKLQAASQKNRLPLVHKLSSRL
ncbi:Utp11 domain protein, partial [Rhizoctonia solani AG-3 Rhs1AP]